MSAPASGPRRPRTPASIRFSDGREITLSAAVRAGIAAVDELEALQPPASLLDQATPEQAQLLHQLSDEATRRTRIARLFKPRQSTTQGRE